MNSEKHVISSKMISPKKPKYQRRQSWKKKSAAEIGSVGSASAQVFYRAHRQKRAGGQVGAVKREKRRKRVDVTHRERALIGPPSAVPVHVYVWKGSLGGSPQRLRKSMGSGDNGKTQDVDAVVVVAPMGTA